MIIQETPMFGAWRETGASQLDRRSATGSYRAAWRHLQEATESVFHYQAGQIPAPVTPVGSLARVSGRCRSHHSG